MSKLPPLSELVSIEIPRVDKDQARALKRQRCSKIDLLLMRKLELVAGTKDDHSADYRNCCSLLAEEVVNCTHIAGKCNPRTVAYFNRRIELTVAVRKLCHSVMYDIEMDPFRMDLWTILSSLRAMYTDLCVEYLEDHPSDKMLSQTDKVLISSITIREPHQAPDRYAGNASYPKIDYSVDLDAIESSLDTIVNTLIKILPRSQLAE